MKDTIDITRVLPIPPEYGRHYAQYFAQQLQVELGIAWRWTDDSTIAFDAPSGVAKGANGTLSVNGATTRLIVKLPFFLAVIGEGIEAQVVKRFDAVEQMARQQAAT
jgi:hypothetical protein